MFQARHHLAAATQIFLEYQRDLIMPSMTDDEKKAAEENFNHRLADVNRCWVKYALNLLSDSRDRLLRDSSEPGKFPLHLVESPSLLILLIQSYYILQMLRI